MDAKAVAALDDGLLQLLFETFMVEMSTKQQDWTLTTFIAWLDSRAKRLYYIVVPSAEIRAALLAHATTTEG